jgi:hypothetical protein
MMMKKKTVSCSKSLMWRYEGRWRNYLDYFFSLICPTDLDNDDSQVQ